MRATDRQAGKGHTCDRGYGSGRGGRVSSKRGWRSTRGSERCAGRARKRSGSVGRRCLAYLGRLLVGCVLQCGGSSRESTRGRCFPWHRRASQRWNGWEGRGDFTENVVAWGYEIKEWTRIWKRRHILPTSFGGRPIKRSMRTDQDRRRGRRGCSQRRRRDWQVNLRTASRGGRHGFWELGVRTTRDRPVLSNSKRFVKRQRGVVRMRRERFGVSGGKRILTIRAITKLFLQTTLMVLAQNVVQEKTSHAIPCKKKKVSILDLMDTVQHSYSLQESWIIFFRLCKCLIYIMWWFAPWIKAWEDQ